MVRAFLIITGTREPTAEQILPNVADVMEALVECAGLPDENVNVSIMEVEFSEFPKGMCRTCSLKCEVDRLFCDECSNAVARAKGDSTSF